MPTEAQHRELAERNRGSLPAVLTAAPEWGAVVVFYIAVHELERLAAADGKDHDTHKKQGTYLNAHPDHNVISGHYIRLRQASEAARYRPIAEYRRKYPDAAAVQLLADSALAAIEKYVGEWFAATTSTPVTIEFTGGVMGGQVVATDDPDPDVRARAESFRRIVALGDLGRVFEFADVGEAGGSAGAPGPTRTRHAYKVSSRMDTPWRLTITLLAVEEKDV